MDTLDKLSTLTLQQLRALCSQNKIQDWSVLSRNAMLRALVNVSEEQNIDLLEGVRG
jgi:hypothetical protein